jgi:hypothetical protein
VPASHVRLKFHNYQSKIFEVIFIWIPGQARNDKLHKTDVIIYNRNIGDYLVIGAWNLVIIFLLLLPSSP